VALHAGGAYTTLVSSILDAGGRGQVINVVPTLLEQLEAYRDGGVTDPVMEALCRPVVDLEPEDRATVLAWSGHVSSRQLQRYPRLRELNARSRSPVDPELLAARYGPGDMRDLQVLTILAHAGDQAWRDQRLAPLNRKGQHFSSDDHGTASAWLRAQPGELITLVGKAAEREGVEIATSPYAHPIMPLLIDTAVVRESWAPNPAPQVPSFRHPEDARRQLEEGLAFMRERGFDPQGCWPPEGSVSAAAVATYGEAGVGWLATDEGILERSLERPLRNGDHVDPALYRPWRLQDGGPAIFFRDRWLSDRIGFAFGRWEDERAAAHELVHHLTGMADALPGDAAIVIALDGENPWLHYPSCGGTFLRELMSSLDKAGDALQPATLGEVVQRAPVETLPRLHPGSWINAVFATWIGHPEKTAGWKLLTRVREAIAEHGDPPPSLLLAEGSDWFWWLGDDNPSPLAPLYDRLFRSHLADSCEQAGVRAPADLDHPLKTVTRPVRVPVSAHWRPPTLDGRMTDYFEWSLASRVDAAGDQPLRRLALWADPNQLYVLVEGARPLQQLVNGDRLTVRLTGPEGDTVTVTAAGDHQDVEGGRCCLGAVAELSLPWDARDGYRLEVLLGASQLPEGAVLLLEPFPVDEEAAAGADPHETNEG